MDKIVLGSKLETIDACQVHHRTPSCVTLSVDEASAGQVKFDVARCMLVARLSRCICCILYTLLPGGWPLNRMG